MRSLFTGALVIGALTVGFAPLAHAQEQGRRGGQQRPGMSEQLKDVLGLTDEQQTKIKAIDDELRADMQKLRSENEGGDWQAMREKMKPLVEKARGKVRDLLTKEQQPKFDEWAKQQDERRGGRQRGGDRGGEDQKPIDSHPDKTIVLPGGGGFDYLNAHADSRRLYVAHSQTIDVIDMDKDEKVGQVEGVTGAHGTAIAAAAKHGFATAGRKKKLIAFDLETLKVLKEIDTDEGPDACMYASSVDEAWAINHRAGTVTCVDAKTFDVKATIAVGGTLEFAAEVGDKVFVNIEDKGQVAVIDAKAHKLITKYDVGADEPAGLAADAKTGVLFIGCGSKKLVAMDSATGKVLGTYDIGSHCDAVAFDAATSKAYASCADGATYVLHEKDAKTFELEKPIPTARGGKCCAIDATSHKLYVAVAPRRGEAGDAKVLVFKTGEATPTDAPKKTESPREPD